MVQKRPFNDEQSYVVSSKHPRQLEYSKQLVSFLEFVPAEDKAQQPNISGEGEGCSTEGDVKHACGVITEHPICTEKDSKTSIPGCVSNTSWPSSGMSEEDNFSKAPFDLLFSPDYFNNDRPVRTFILSKETYKTLLECPPRKLVPVGPDFQAEIPNWSPPDSKNVSDGSVGSEPLTFFPRASELDLSDHNEDENKLAGICVIPMPELVPLSYNSDKVGDGRTDCCCEDSGSVRCVRQHIKESRVKLWRTLGPRRFFELGFSNTGEEVADKWSLEEEQLFHHVVFSNPASLGKNFWDCLSLVFPSRTKKEIVSYYFNVFMLRRRAEQNIHDSMNIDSDDDEWQGSDDSGEDFGSEEEDDDSVVESPVCRGNSGDDEILEYDSNECNDSPALAGFNNYENIVVDYDGKGNHWGELLWDENGNHDIEDDSCTSSDAGTALPKVKANYSKNCFDSFSSMNGVGSHEFVLEPCDTKVWDIGYFTCPKNKVEFLPTCSVIEEVFGVGAWNHKSSDDGN